MTARTPRPTWQALCTSCGTVRSYTGNTMAPMLKCATCDRRVSHHLVGAPGWAEQAEQREHRGTSDALAEVTHWEGLLRGLGVTWCDTDKPIDCLYEVCWQGNPHRVHLWIHPDATIAGREVAYEAAIKSLTRIDKEDRERGRCSFWMPLDKLDDRQRDSWLIASWHRHQLRRAHEWASGKAV